MSRAEDEQVELLDAYWGTLIDDTRMPSPPRLDPNYARVAARIVNLLAPPEPDVAFVQRLRRRIEVQDAPARRPYEPRRRRRLSLFRWAVAAFVVGVLSTLVVIIQPFSDRSDSSLGDEAFGLLPYPAVETGVGGPPDPADPADYGQISYSINPGLSVPEFAAAYELVPQNVTEGRVREIAQELGFTDAPQPIVSGDGQVVGYRVESLPPGCVPEDPPTPECEPEALLEMRTDGFVFYRSSLSPQDSVGRPNEDQVLAAAQRWMQLTGIAEDANARVTISAGPSEDTEKAGGESIGQALITLALPSTQIVDGPEISVLVDGNGNIWQASGQWASLEASSDYPLKDTGEVVDSLRSDRGDFFEFQNITSEPLQVDYLKDAEATVIDVDVGYASGAAAQGLYLVPIYVVSGRFTQDGLNSSVPFVTWIPAADTASAGSRSPTPTSTALSLNAVFDSLPIPPQASFVSQTMADGHLVASYSLDGDPRSALALFEAPLAEAGWERIGTQGPVQEGQMLVAELRKGSLMTRILASADPRAPRSILVLQLEVAAD